MASDTSTIFSGLRKIVRTFGFDVIRYREDGLDIPSDFDRATAETIRFVRPFTQTSPERISSLCEAVRYVVRARIPGAIVECGVWRGGSMMAVARTLIDSGDTDRTLHLFDTFQGMSPPTSRDISVTGQTAESILREQDKEDPRSAWCVATLEDVQNGLALTGYPKDRVVYAKGRVEDTIPGSAPETIAVLRLDTDWYESTKHELEHLFPRLVRGGVLIIDDYSHWRGARQAVDEYLAESGVKLLLNRIDYTGRIAIKIE